MNKPKVGVVGGGVVGKATVRMCGPETVVYDPYLDGCAATQDEINACDVTFVSVPTPMAADGTCDTSIVEDVVRWIATPLIIIRSTIAPGTTDRLRARHGKRIVFQPEYLGETPAHVFAEMGEREFVVLGGAPEDVSAAADLYKHYYNSYVRFYFCDARTAELAKYMENAFYAVKVTFVNEFYEIARAHDVDFNTLREIWLADPRISRDHTFVYPEARGFDGKCLPKDCNAIVQSAIACGYPAPFMDATLRINEFFRRHSAPRRAATAAATPATNGHGDGPAHATRPTATAKR